MWYINFGASHHFTDRKDWCINYVADSSCTNSVVFGGGREFIVEGKVNV